MASKEQSKNSKTINEKAVRREDEKKRWRKQLSLLQQPKLTTLWSESECIDIFQAGDSSRLLFSLVVSSKGIEAI